MLIVSEGVQTMVESDCLISPHGRDSAVLWRMQEDGLIGFQRPRTRRALKVTIPAVLKTLEGRLSDIGLADASYYGCLELYEDGDIDVTRFVVPSGIYKWEVENFISPRPNRRQSLLMIGGSRTGKTSLAQHIVHSHGKISEFENEWNMDMFWPGQVCAFSHMCNGFPYWKPIFGCQLYFNAHGRYLGKRRLDWVVPSVWVCNRDDDPRKWGDGHGHRIEQNAVVYEIPEGYALFKGGPYESMDHYTDSEWPEGVPGRPSFRWEGEALDRSGFCLDDVELVMYDGAEIPSI
ncbi:predicted protein [Aspergillus nidulans FGSC A4]|uniref:Uncharacterized protein n=1 Tax=Emericella nidulans (strain FGSC A4 / ATCC 38163 / CBS 112.46 / NRRL 194 / M139) TaxID=227321 RepID=Q5B6D9_EMENI|nr:hypothetical protein [Aspergillus nidulans FGSC A4]EAA59156.1 predicted protein [Aspergillus nidulans FGSC A4]CBF75158.1 TPA: conserved hypothetical protein [Aspergillus nidulans FGSC A4]|eukprot:XP_661495.1 predicted protein [Aspergillus nidulans FGSC A4]